LRDNTACRLEMAGLASSANPDVTGGRRANRSRLRPLGTHRPPSRRGKGTDQAIDNVPRQGHRAASLDRARAGA